MSAVGWKEWKFQIGMCCNRDDMSYCEGRSGSAVMRDEVVPMNLDRKKVPTFSWHQQSRKCVRLDVCSFHVECDNGLLLRALPHLREHSHI